MSYNMKAPPKLEDESQFEIWKNDIDIWCDLTEIPEEKRALAIHLSLAGRARAATSEMQKADLKKKDGVKLLLDKLDSLFLVDKGRRQFAAFHELYNFRRKDDSDISAFVTEFEHVYFKFTRQDMTLPDSVMAFMLLASCSLSEAERQLVMSAITDVTYDKMKSALKRIFCGDITQKGISSSSAIEIKSEPVFYAKENYDRDDDAAAVMYSRGSFRGKSSWRGRRNTRGTPATGANRQPVDRVGRKQNPVGPDGKTSRCLVCDSRFHWARQCPDAYENNKRKGESYRLNEDLDDDKEDMVHLSLFVGYTNESRSYKLDKSNA